MKRPRVKETILAMWYKGMRVYLIAETINKSIDYVFNKLKKYGEIPQGW